MKKNLTLLLLLFFIGYSSLSSKETNPPLSEELQVLKQNILTDFITMKVLEKDVVKVAAEMRPDGSWASINYADQTRGGWPVADHLKRVLNMAILYNRNGTALKGDPVLKEKIMLGLNHWLKNDYINPNWWNPQIGIPKLLGPAMLLMEEHLTAEQRKAGLKILDRAKIGMTGQNKVWLSGNVIYRSLLSGEVEPVKAAAKAIHEELVVSEGEGIQVDQSFHQHGPQQQFGNYGLSFVNDMVNWATIFRNTPFQFSDQQITILRNYLLNGMRWIIWNKQMDISACGRQLFPRAQVEKAKTVMDAYTKMPFIDPVFKTAYQKAFDNFTGNKHFWRSDMTVHRRANFYTSVKMVSSRVAGAESCNSENIQGYHLGDGATYFYQSNREYSDIFPFWNWRLIPGTTAFYDTVPLPVLPCEGGYRIESDFVGGVSDGLNGIATLAYDRDKLLAKKSYFFFDDAVICLGAGINASESKEVRTAINQSFLNSAVQVKQATTITSVQKGQHSLQAVNWIIHDKWGYFFPKGETVELTNREQTGQWNDIVKRIAPEPLKADLFTLYINHQSQPKDASYAYFVFPQAAATSIAKRGDAISVVHNSKEKQVVEIGQKGLAGFVFYTAGDASAKTVKDISVNQPCVVMTHKKASATTITVSDPTHKLNNVTIGVGGRKRSMTIPSTYDAAKNRTLFTVSLPQGSYAGRSAMFTIK